MEFELTERMVLRCDGSRRLGLGHLARCAVLAAHLAPGRARLICRDDPLARGFLAGRGVEASFLPADCTVEEEPELLARLCAAEAAQFVVLDRKDNDREYVASLVRSGLYVVDIEDRGEGRAEAHVLVDNHIWPGSLDSSYRGRALCGFGPDWALLDPRHAAAAAEPEREPAESRLLHVHEVLVSLGGTDPAGLTRTVLAQLDRAPGNFRISLAVPHSLELSGIECRFHELRVLRGLDCLAGVLAEAQLAVVSGGVTMLEALCVGTPVLVVPQHREQYVNAARFALRACLSLAPAPEAEDHRERLFRAIEQLVEDPVLRIGLAKAGAALVDGRGLERLAGALAYLESACRERAFRL